jgi:hypothetical protein
MRTHRFLLNQSGGSHTIIASLNLKALPTRKAGMRNEIRSNRSSPGRLRDHSVADLAAQLHAPGFFNQTRHTMSDTA